MPDSLELDCTLDAATTPEENPSREAGDRLRGFLREIGKEVSPISSNLEGSRRSFSSLPCQNSLKKVSNVMLFCKPSIRNSVERSSGMEPDPLFRIRAKAPGACDGGEQLFPKADRDHCNPFLSTGLGTGLQAIA